MVIFKIFYMRYSSQLSTGKRQIVLNQPFCKLRILLHWLEQNAQALWSTCSLTFCQDQGRQSRSSQGRADGVTLLVNIDPAVPTAPGLCGGKHAATTTHLQWSQGSTFHTKRLFTPNECLHQSKIVNIFQTNTNICMLSKKIPFIKTCRKLMQDLCFWSNAQTICCNNTLKVLQNTTSHLTLGECAKATYLHAHSAHPSKSFVCVNSP